MVYIQVYTTYMVLYIENDIYTCCSFARAAPCILLKFRTFIPGHTDLLSIPFTIYA